MQKRPRPLSWYKASVKILDTLNEDVHKVRFLDHHLRGTMIHWKGRANVPCQFENCKTPIHDWLCCWKGYCPGEWWIPTERLWIPIVIAGTAHFELLTRGRDLKGQIWKLYREGFTNKNWPMMGVFEEQSSPDQCGPWFDMEIVVRNIFRPHAVFLDIPNPTAAKVVLPTNNSAGPTSEQSESPKQKPLSDLAGIKEELARRMTPPQPSNGGGKINGNPASHESAAPPK